MNRKLYSFRRFAACCVAAFSLLIPAGSQAGQITNVTWYSGVASVAGTTIYPPDEINNDNAVGVSSNTFEVLQKHYVGIGPVDLVFDVADTGGTTEYVFLEGVSNSTGLDWSGYHIELGFGTGGGFVASGAGDGLDFDAPDYDSLVNFDPGPGFFPITVVTEDDIVASGGIFYDTQYAGNFIFHIDVPDGITEFTVRQSPIAIPEPSTAVLALFGLIGLIRFRYWLT